MKESLKRNPKSFYTFVNSKRKCVEFPATMKYLSIESDDDVIIADMFADFFSSTYSNSNYDNTCSYPYEIKSNQTINLPLFDAVEIEKQLKCLKASFTYGPDGVPSCLLKNCAASISLPLSIIFNLSIKYGYFPKKLKNSFIAPLFKSDKKSDVTNYRGIANLSSISKVFEKLITNFLTYAVSTLLSEPQHGFRKGCSTTTNILHFTTIINQGLLSNSQTDVIYSDFSKAFDKVNHELLINKLHLMGFSNRCLCWFRSYLNDRWQNVQYKNRISKNIKVHSGVPQGSHLGPVLFSLFINDLPSVFKHANTLMFADDVKIFLTINNSSSYLYLQDDLSRFYTWCKVNLMELNLNKCKLMRFFRNNAISNNYHLGDHPLELVDSINDLGILLDPKLSFVPHINMTINKARGVLAFIKRWAKEFTDPYVTKLLFTSLVRPILEYGSVIWDPFYNIYVDRIESIQKQFLLFCLRGLPWNPEVNLPSYESRLGLIKLPTLKSRRIMLNVTFILNLLKGYTHSVFLLSNISLNVPNRPTRYFQPIKIKVFRTNFANADPLRRMSVNFNDLFNHVDYSTSTNLIKRNIITFLNC